jgi:hypothetical protein
MCLVGSPIAAVNAGAQQAGGLSRIIEVEVSIGDVSVP